MVNNLDLIFMVTKKGLVPMCGKYYKDDLYIVNLNNTPNRDLLEGIPYDEDKQCLLIDGKSGKLLFKSHSPQNVRLNWENELCYKFEQYKQDHYDDYVDECADYLRKIQELKAGMLRAI